MSDLGELNHAGIAEKAPERGYGPCFKAGMNSIRYLALASTCVLAACLSTSDEDALFSEDELARRSLTVNDVSVLYPLPTTQTQADSMLGPTSAGPRGALLPRRLFDEVP